jgi:AraC-like DNA-binding protein
MEQALGRKIDDTLSHPAQHWLRVATENVAKNTPVHGTVDCPDTDFKLAVIAARCGFAHAAQLCNVFKKTFGLTPTEHRRQCQPWTKPPT